jgi:hypothetical protein
MRKKLRYAFFVILSTLVICEVGLRLLGYQVDQPPKIKLAFSPDHCFKTDSVWGIRLEPGKYQVTINEGLTYQVTHTQQGERICGYITDSVVRPEWWFLGCSMTYGMGVDDSCTYPYLVQQALPQNKIRNLAIPGTGGLHQYLRLKKALDEGQQPQAVFFSYMDFHDSRNVFSSSTAKVIGIGVASNKRPQGSSFWGYAYARKQAETFQIRLKDLSRTRATIPGIRYLALCNTLQNIIDQKNDAKLPMQEVSQHYLLEANHLCQLKGIRFAVVFMRNGGSNDTMRKFCMDQHIRVIDVSVDFSNPAMTNLPYDPHPSPQAHGIMATKFLSSLQENPIDSRVD